MHTIKSFHAEFYAPEFISGMNRLKADYDRVINAIFYLHRIRYSIDGEDLPGFDAMIKVNEAYAQKLDEERNQIFKNKK